MTIKKGSVTIASSVPTTEWGSIEGTLADQTDLKNSLDAKAPTLSPAFTGVPTAPTAEDGTNTNQVATTKYVRTAISNAISEAGLLPEQTGQSGKYLTTNGTTASWATVDALPSQTGQSGKVLTTNGTTASWTEYSPAPSTDGDTIHLNSSDELEAIGTIEKNAGNVKYDWIGTYAQWVAGRNNSTIPDDWICYITDDYEETKVAYNIGDIFYSLRTEDALNGAVVCDGSSYNTADYSSGAQSVKNLLDNNKLPYVSISDFDATVTAKGSCRCFGYDGGSTFKVPKLNDVFVEVGSANTANEFIDESLPNIKGNIFAGGGVVGTSAGGTALFRTAEGAFSLSTQYQYAPEKSSSGWAGQYPPYGNANFNAHNSSSIYQDNAHVQPKAVKYRAFIQLVTQVSDEAIQEVEEAIADISDLKDAMKETVNYKNITNCITEISQDIKVELNNGTLTLKAGSKVYVPNGFEEDGTTPKFDIKIVESDISQTFGSTTGTDLIFLKQNNTFAWYSDSASGTTPPSTGALYDTSLNKVQGYNGGSLNSDNNSFPFCLVTLSNGSVISIDQVFNGFGYIGSTVFALPGVKGLSPDGKNLDGTLKNKEVGVNSVTTRTLPGYNWAYCWINHNLEIDFDRFLYISDKQPTPSNDYGHWLNTQENKFYRYYNNGWYSEDCVVVAQQTVEQSSPFKVTSFTPKTVFHALDYSDKSIVSSWSMPSGKYIDITSTSGSSYTAPANGWICFKNNNTGTANVQAYIENTTKSIISTVSSYYNNGGGYVPVSRGDSVTITRSSGVGVVYYRFVYAEGEI